MKRLHVTRIRTVMLYFFIILLLCVVLLPFVWLLLGSFKNQRELFTTPIQIFPNSLRWENYVRVFESQPFGDNILNSLIVSLLTTFFVIIIASMTSYSIARVDIKGKKLVLAGLLAITLLPPVTLLNPLYMLLNKVNLLNTHLGLAISLMVIELPMAVWFLTSYFDALPMAMEESAMIDGAGMFTMFRKILMPLLAPGVFTVSILIFINAWNNYLFAQVFNQLPKARTVTVALTLLRVDEFTISWEIISAGAIIVTAPLVLVVLLLQKRIISGMMDGGIKG